jgi:hypothetical protein
VGFAANSPVFPASVHKILSQLILGQYPIHFISIFTHENAVKSKKSPFIFKFITLFSPICAKSNPPFWAYQIWVLAIYLVVLIVVSCPNFSSQVFHPHRIFGLSHIWDFRIHAGSPLTIYDDSTADLFQRDAKQIQISYYPMSPKRQRGGRMICIVGAILCGRPKKPPLSTGDVILSTNSL